MGKGHPTDLGDWILKSKYQGLMGRTHLTGLGELKIADDGSDRNSISPHPNSLPIFSAM